MHTVTNSPLGKKSRYIAEYQRELLFPIPRIGKRQEIHVPAVLPFVGADIWNGFEISWLNAKGKPVVVVGEFIFPCTSPYIIESKSFKLYLNSFNNTAFDSISDVTKIMIRDLSEAAGAPVHVVLTPVAEVRITTSALSGINLDLLDVACDIYETKPDFLSTTEKPVSETVYSDLLKSNCLVTGQPDWGSVQITYTGNQISHEGLLKYIVSFRNHNEFHEQCVERIFMDIWRRCKPTRLSVLARYTRRGGLDINPYRSTEIDFIPSNDRLCRQ